MTSAQTVSMMTDCVSITFPSLLDAVTEVDIAERRGEEHDGDCDKNQILHTFLLPGSLLAAEALDQAKGGCLLPLLNAFSAVVRKQCMAKT